MDDQKKGTAVSYIGFERPKIVRAIKENGKKLTI
jgi:hypothetical protein